jgi:hypothetical protein
MLGRDSVNIFSVYMRRLFKIYMIISAIYIRLINASKSPSRGRGVVHDLEYNLMNVDRQVKLAPTPNSWGSAGTSAQRDYNTTVWADV